MKVELIAPFLDENRKITILNKILNKDTQNFRYFPVS